MLEVRCDPTPLTERRSDPPQMDSGRRELEFKGKKTQVLKERLEVCGHPHFFQQDNILISSQDKQERNNQHVSEDALGGCIHQNRSQLDRPFRLTTDLPNAPAWKQLITHTLTTDGRISLITEVFSDTNQVGVVGRLVGDDAQAFVDIVDKVRLPVLPLPKNGWVYSCPNLYALPVRCWIGSKNRSVRNVRARYIRSVATKPYFRGH